MEGIMGKFDMLKKAGAMKSQMKKMQKEMAKQTAEGRSGGVTAVARGDMTLRSIAIDPDGVDVANTDQLQRQIVAAVNTALSSVQKVAAAEMAKSAGGLGGLADMLG
jgi:DNA-binding YbaB/EbfC family protein